MKSLTVLILSTLIGSSLFAQEKEIEIKEQKFISNNNICLFSKKEQDVAKDYFLSMRDSQNITLKIALTVLQLRIINNAKFTDVNCGLRFFIERYKEKYSSGYNPEPESPAGAMVSEYLKILEKLRTDPKTKLDFEKNILSSNEINYYYSVLGKNANDYNILELNLARKIYSANLTSKNQRTFTQDEWQILFNLYYLKNTALPKELNDYIKALLNRSGYQSRDFMNIYLLNANELAYNDLFKAIFEITPPASVAYYFDSNTVNTAQAKNVFLSPFIPDSFKCHFARESVAKNAPKLSAEGVEELKQLKISCLNDALVDASKFIYPTDGCPQILFDKNEDKTKLISKMSNDFASSWSACRKKCNQGEKCTAVKESNGLYSYFNLKFEKDLPLYKDMQPKASSRIMPLTYDYKPAGVCTEKGSCGEKNISCVDSDIAKKLNDEIKAAKYQVCKEDNDCYIFPASISGCTELAVNLNPSNALMPGMITNNNNNNNNKSHRINPSGYPDFLALRIQRLSEDCGKPFNQWACQQQASTSTSTAKCVKNLCVVVK